MEANFRSADIRIEYLRLKGIKNIQVPVNDFNKEFYNSIKHPYLLDCSILYGIIAFAHDKSEFLEN